jgi:long-chain acyl-CoA synthetase
VEVKTAQPEPTPPSPAGRLLLRGGGPQTFPELLDRFVRAHGERVFLPRRRARVVEPVTFRRLCTDVEQIAAGLLALGVERGDRVGLIADNRYEWLLADLGTTWFGGVDGPRGSDTPPAELLFILRHSGCRAAFVDDDRIAALVLARRAELPALQHVIVLTPGCSTPGAMGLAVLTERGRVWQRSSPGRLQLAAAAVRRDDLLTIVYTSGTTADPKGVMLTHGNVLANIEAVTQVLHITGADSFLSVLPAWHMYERIMDYLALTAGGQLVYTDRRHIKEDLQQVAPTVFAAVPRIWETIHDGLIAHAAKMTSWRGRLLRRALGLCRAVGSGKASLWQRLQLRALAPVVRRLQAITGGRLRLAVSGGGSLPRHVDETLLGIGLPLLNGYGLTETSPVASVRLPERNCSGTIGPPLPGTEIEARDANGASVPTGSTGVLWIRGPQVMRGYYENPQKTQEVLTADGWFNSGDLGHIDTEGRVWITGRQKDTIVLIGGENVEPEPIETAAKTSPLIEQVVCLGQDQRILGALIVPAFELLEQAVPRRLWDERAGQLQGKAVAEAMRKELDRLINRDTGFRQCDRICTFRVLTEPLTIENGCLTPTLKVRRHVVQQRFAALIAAMFS